MRLTRKDGPPELETRVSRSSPEPTAPERDGSAVVRAEAAADRPARPAAGKRPLAGQEHLDPVLERIALKLTGNKADARDLVQDTWERGLSNADKLRPGSNPRAWLVTIMHNLFLDRCRRRKTQPRSEPIDEVAVAAPEPDPEPSWAAVTIDQIRAALVHLDPKFREVFELREFEGESYQDIAARLGIPKHTVGTRLRRARNKLRRYLQDAAQGGQSRDEE